MSVISFIEHAGERLFGAAAAPQPPGVTPASCSADENAEAGAAIARYIAAQHLVAQDLTVTFDGRSKTVTVKGIAPDQATREKILLCCGNVHSVAKVDDQLTVEHESAAYPPSTWYEVKSGDTLSGIAKTVYGEAGVYETILEANQPMLRDPDRIYPGQQLRIPPKAG